MALDGAGNIYVLASYDYTWVDINKSAGLVAVLKFDPAGKLLWTTWIKQGTRTYFAPSGIGVDSAGNSYVLVGDGTLWGDNASIHKLDTLGKTVWTVALDPNALTYPKGIAVDSNGYIYVTGGTADVFGSIRLDATKGGYFVAKMSPQGTWVWAKEAGGSGWIPPYGGVAVDSQGNAFMAGRVTMSTATFDSHALPYDSSGYVAKLDKGGKSWLWALGILAYSDARAWDLTADAQGNAYVTGWFWDVVVSFGNRTTLQLVSGHQQPDIYVAKVSSTGTPVWAVRGGMAPVSDEGLGIGLDRLGNVYNAGDIAWPGTFGTYKETNPQTGAYLAKLTSTGTVSWVRTGEWVTGRSYGYAVAVGSSSAYVVGRFTKTSKLGSTSLASQGPDDLFLWKLATTP